ncbi:exosortase-associated EpsI family protein [Frigoriglobus tundricola]|uniref:Methanolan biosynthesis EpsI domain-containing protein n=1 Tax=Frigoriglobus tundricola TaxID=2774151 RepID=A0A6M5YHB6_9BACT|nr:exosortase-associated EpsI family protein [Frigoriglobus tundricola]QJW93358.1 hypothetical protein FTUN_0864 [Frigoriglobus tundricola]
MPRWLVIGLAVVGLIAAAVLEGVTSGRWRPSEDVRAAAAKLDAVPTAFGDWTSAEVPMNEKVLAVAEATGHVSRMYTHRKNRTQVVVLLLCGESGPIGAHTPEVCYSGNGLSMTGTPQKKAVGLPTGTATYWSVLFDRPPAAPEPPLRVCWAWGTDGNWQASENPRADFALHGALYKLYVQRPEARAPESAPAGTTPDVIAEFLTDFLPEVKKALAAPSAQP